MALMEEQIYAFIEHSAAQRGYAANTLAAYRNDLVQFYQFLSIERPHLSSWARVDTLLLQGFLLHLKARAYSAASIARKVAALKSFYFYLFENQQIPTNPTANLDAPPVLRNLPRPLTEDQVYKLLAVVSEASPKGYRDRAMLELLYAAGLRVTELVTLPVHALDLQLRTLRVDGAEGARVLSLSQRALDALRAYLDKGRSGLKAQEGSGTLFVNSRGEQLTRQGVWLIIKNYAKRAGIDAEITPHSLRHSFAAHRLAQGERIQDLQRLLGHAHLSTTLVYGRQRELED
jgi:integrase/recombinase XerD